MTSLTLFDYVLDSHVIFVVLYVCMTCFARSAIFLFPQAALGSIGGRQGFLLPGLQLPNLPGRLAENKREI